MRNAMLVTMMLQIGSATAWAETPLTQLMITPHNVETNHRVDEGTVSFGAGGVAYFAGPDATYLVSVRRGKTALKRMPGHPRQAHHRASDSIEIEGQSALVLLADDRKGLKLVSFDTQTKGWVDIERPLGFVPGPRTVVGHHVVFPQRARSPTWFVYDGRSREFRPVARPDHVTSCEGVAFGWKQAVVVAGTDRDATLCAVSYDPTADTWRDLPAPPVAPGPVVAATKSKTLLIGSGLRTVGWDGKKWTTYATGPTFSGPVQRFATPKRVVLWQSSGQGLAQWTYDHHKDAWTETREAIPLDLDKVVALAPGHWLGVARHKGKPALVELRWAPNAGMKERAANRAALAPEGDAKRDWAQAGEEERRAAIERGLGAVERYVPPVVDEQGKIETKGAWVFALGEALVVWPVTPKQCARFLEKLLQKWPTQTFGSTWPVERGAGFARSGKHWLYTPIGQCRERQKCPADYYSERFQPLSQVGPVFSYVRHRNAAVDCGEPSSEVRWIAIDLRTNKPAALDAMIDEASLLAALKRHKTLGKVVGDADSLDAAIDALRKLDATALGGYAFGRWRAATRQVQMLLEFRPDNRDTVEPITVWVDPLEEFVDIFERSTRVEGSYMGGVH